MSLQLNTNMLQYVCKTKTNNDYFGITLFFIGSFLFVLFLQRKLNLAKTQIPQPLWIVIPRSFAFVWRKLGFAFFGALTLVGALFVSPKKLQ